MKNSFVYYGAKLYNSIAKDIRESKLLSSFSQNIAAHIWVKSIVDDVNSVQMLSIICCGYYPNNVLKLYISLFKYLPSLYM